MKITHITTERREEWNAFVAKEPSFALLQSWEWGEFKEKMGWKVFRIVAEKKGRIVAGVQMLIRPIPPRLTSIAYIPRGPVGEWLDEEVLSLLLTEIHQVARQSRAIFLRIEPLTCSTGRTDAATRTPLPPQPLVPCGSQKGLTANKLTIKIVYP